MKRPTPQDIFGKNATPDSIKKMYADSPDLFKYAQALDRHIDYLEKNSKLTSEEEGLNYADKEYGNKTHIPIGFIACIRWLNAIAKLTKKQ